MSADRQARNRALLAGFIGFMAKPMESWELADRISRLTGRVARDQQYG